MITFFSTPKPFRGHIGIIQRNAIRSWKLTHPDAEVILFGNEEGAAEVAAELGARHDPEVDRNAHGTPLLSSLFRRADRLAGHDRLCFLNADILLTDDFLAASTRLAQLRDRSLMVGRRCDVDITEPLDFSKPNWRESVRALARDRGKLRPPQWIDYFVFPRDLLRAQVPDFAVGRPGYDNWLLWKVRAMGIPVVDATEVVLAIHQNHDHSQQGGETTFWNGAEAQQNYALLGNHFATLDKRHAPAHTQRTAAKSLSLGRAREAQGAGDPQRRMVRPSRLDAPSTPPPRPARAAQPRTTKISQRYQEKIRLSLAWPSQLGRSSDPHARIQV